MSKPSRDELDRVRAVYKTMAIDERYRPCAPGDGFGNITVPDEDLDLEAEANHYAKQWANQEETRAVLVGVPDARTHRALVFAIEACRLMCANDPQTASRLVAQAQTALKP